MKSPLVMLWAILAACVVLADAQTSAQDSPKSVEIPPPAAYRAQVLYNVRAPYRFGPSWGPYGWYPAGTPAGSYARGVAAMTRAQGDYNLLTSQAKVANAEAQRQEMENRLTSAEAYFKLRELNREYRAKLRGPRPSAEDLIRLARARAPARLMNYQYDPDRGEISWPELLQRPRFEPQRQQLEALFAQGNVQAPGSGFPYKVDRVSRQMHEKLLGMVRQVNQMEYIAAKNFLRSLAYEARFVPQLEAVAAN